MKKSLITLLSVTALMSATFVSAETPTTATTEPTTTQTETPTTSESTSEQVETFPKDNMINNDMDDNTETGEGQNWLELPNSDEWRYNGFQGHKSLTPPTTTEQTQTVPQPQEQTQTVPQATTTQQPQEITQVTNEPTAQQLENATKESAVFAVDTLPQTGSRDILGDILEVLGFALLIGIAVYLSYTPIKRKLNRKKN